MCTFFVCKRQKLFQYYLTENVWIFRKWIASNQMIYANVCMFKQTKYLRLFYPIFVWKFQTIYAVDVYICHKVSTECHVFWLCTWIPWIQKLAKCSLVHITIVNVFVNEQCGKILWPLPCHTVPLLYKRHYPNWINCNIVFFPRSFRMVMLWSNSIHCYRQWCRWLSAVALFSTFFADLCVRACEALCTCFVYVCRHFITHI